MSYESFDQIAIKGAFDNSTEKMKELGKMFSSGLKPENNIFTRGLDGTSKQIAATWIGLENVSLIDNIPDMQTTLKEMYYGNETSLGRNLSLKTISEWNVNPEYKVQNIRQHAGYAAEVISTTKENLEAQAKGLNSKTYRADDRPDLFSMNDQYVDKIRCDSNGKVIERIQTKFVGGNADECFAKLKSKSYDKYFNDGKLDKIEIPKDYFEGVKNDIADDKIKVQKQIDHLTNVEGKEEALSKLQSKMERLNKMDNMLEQSNVTSSEAEYAVQHPKRYMAKITMADTLSKSVKAGEQTGLSAAAITAAVSTVNNISHIMDGTQTVEDGIKDIAKETATAGGVGFTTGFITAAVSNTMSVSSHELIKAVGNSSIPASVIAVGVSSFDSIEDYAQGVIDEKKLAYDIGENVATVAGSVAMGAAMGSVVPGAGTVTGAALGLVGSVVGTAVSAQAYKTAINLGSKGAEVLASKSKECAENAIDTAKEIIPDKVEGLKTAFNDYASKFNLGWEI